MDTPTSRRRTSNFYGSRAKRAPTSATATSHSNMGGHREVYGRGMSLRDIEFTFENSGSDSSADDERPLATQLSYGDSGPMDFDFEFPSPQQHAHTCSNQPSMSSSQSANQSFQPSSAQPIQQSSTRFEQSADFVSLLQAQQSTLEKVLEGQRKLESRQDKIEETLASLADDMQKFKSVSSGPDSSPGGRKRKRVVTRALSNKVYSIHDKMDLKFNLSEIVNSDHNKKVQSSLLGEITNQPGCKFVESDVKVAIKRCYENHRRNFLEQQPGKENYSKEQSLNRKYRSRRERKFKRRTGVVTPVEMEKYWTFLSLHYMTEESDDPDNTNGLIEHRIPWRSKRLDEFMVVLDQRLSKNETHPVGLVAKKVRKAGSPSNSSPPSNAPTWAVNPNYAKDKENDQPAM